MIQVFAFPFTSEKKNGMEFAGYASYVWNIPGHSRENFGEWAGAGDEFNMGIFMSM